MSFSGQPLRWHALRKTGLFAICAAAVLSTGAVQARGHTEKPSPGSVELTSLPAEAGATYRLILAGGPFPHDKDGVVFGNREQLLPAQKRGYYHEYTVPTPGAHNRGARRIVCGGVPPERPQACFYTGDHYASFRLIAR